MDPNIHHGDIEQQTIDNTYFRRVVDTTSNMQLVVMCIKAGDDIPLELHEDHDQFFRIESGNATIHLGQNESQHINLNDGDYIIIPAGTWHRVINTGKDSLKLYTIYSPPEHKPDRIDVERPDDKFPDSTYEKKYIKYKKLYYNSTNWNGV